VLRKKGIYRLGGGYLCAGFGRSESPGFFLKKGCVGVDFGVNYADIFKRENSMF
jgi:hypothetical protein